MRYKRIMQANAFWLVLLFALDGFFAALLWLANAAAFAALVPVIFLATVLLFSVICVVIRARDKRRKQAFLSFLETPDKEHEELLSGVLDVSKKDAVCILGEVLREKQNQYSQAQLHLCDYEEYVELWAHEIKIPLSLVTMILDNRREELPEEVRFKLDYARSRIQESVEQMLFYARLKGETKDYLFETVDLKSCIEDILEEYRPLLEEKQFSVMCSVEDGTVYTDRRGIHFLLGQVVSNAVKYAGKEPRLYFTAQKSLRAYTLTVRDNGTGVKACDLPYIFEKGFTGDSGSDRKKATGMGLYLAREMANDLNVTLRAESVWGAGFTMRIEFPLIEEKSGEMD